MNAIRGVGFVKLVKYVAIVSGVGSGGLLITREYLRSKFQSAGYFKRTVKIVDTNQTVGKLLGRPIKFGKLDLGDNKKFYATQEKAFFTVKAWGPHDSGMVTSYCLRSPPSEEPSESLTEESDDGIPNDGWEVSRVELRVTKHKDKRLIVFRKPEADEEFVNTFHDFIYEGAQ